MKLQTNRFFFKTPAEAIARFKIDINVQESFENVVPKIFNESNTPLFHEDEFSNNMAYSCVTLETLIKIHRGKYMYEIIHPERDIPAIAAYLKWFVETYQSSTLTLDQQDFYNSIKEVSTFFTDLNNKLQKKIEATRSVPSTYTFDSKELSHD